jgi:hypothetical protein
MVEYKLLGIRSDEVLLMAQRIFGEALVVEAFVAEYKLNDDLRPLDDQCERMRNNVSRYSVVDKEYDEILLERFFILLKFSNGKLVSFGSSEWGEIVEASTDNLTVIE